MYGYESSLVSFLLAYTEVLEKIPYRKKNISVSIFMIEDNCVFLNYYAIMLGLLLI